MKQEQTTLCVGVYNIISKEKKELTKYSKQRP